MSTETATTTPATTGGKKRDSAATTASASATPKPAAKPRKPRKPTVRDEIVLVIEETGTDGLRVWRETKLPAGLNQDNRGTDDVRRALRREIESGERENPTGQLRVSRLSTSFSFKVEVEEIRRITVSEV